MRPRGNAQGSRATTAPWWGAACGAIALLAACSSPPPPPPPPTMLSLKLTATSDVNPTAAGQGAPVVVRLYQLASSASFDSAEFFRLYNSDAATLGPDLVKKEEYLLAPGESRQVTLAPTDQVRMLGVFGAYRDFSKVTWRVSVPVPPHKTTNLVITAGAHGVTVAGP